MASMLGEGKIVQYSVYCVDFVNDGKQQRITHHVQNCTAISRKLRAALSKDTDKVFTLLTGRDERILAAGLRLPVTINYCPPKTGIAHKGTLELFADDVLQLKIPINGDPPAPNITFTPSFVEFGHSARNHEMLTRTITVSNTGSGRGKYSLFSSHLPSYITVDPTEGFLESGSTCEIKVNLLCREICSICESISVTTDPDNKELTIPVTGDIVAAKLEILDPTNLSPMEALSLDPSYYGTIVNKKVMLYNNSPSSVSYIALMDNQCIGFEQGVDMSGNISMACTSGGLYQNSWKEQGSSPATDKMLRVFPNEGTLLPYETHPVELTFTPIFQSSEKGWNHHQGMASRRDYAIFIRFLPVSESMKSEGEGGVELGVTVSALPVDISSTPSKQLRFGPSSTGLPHYKKFILYNNSDTLPINYNIRIPAHYKIQPNKGNLSPGAKEEFNVVFHPKQFGGLNGSLIVDVLGKFGEKKEVIYSHSVSLVGSGIVAESACKRKETKMNEATLDDLSCSIRPHDKRVVVSTPFTKVRRHTYIDPDYALDDNETFVKMKHRDYYQHYLEDKRKKRLKRNIDKKLGNEAYYNSTDIGLQPAAGIIPPCTSPPHLSEMDDCMVQTDSLSKTICTTQDQYKATTQQLKIVDSPITKPCSVSMVEQCQFILSPKQLTKIQIDHAALELGEVVVDTKIVREIKMKNYLSQHVMCTMKISSPSLRILSSDGNDSQWTFILSPHSYTPVNVAFTSHSCGEYHQSIECRINRDHTYNIPVMAITTRISLHPSPSLITLSQFPLSTHNTCLHGTVSLYNPHHVPAHYSWDLGNHSDYLIFSSSDGTVPPKSTIQCELLCHEVTECPQTLSISLNVEGGDSKEIHCTLQYGKSQCSFKETVLFFNPAPLYRSTTKTITCTNKGDSHAYYQVMGCHPPIQGVTIHPMTGCVPAGGSAKLFLQLCATEMGRFESWFKLRLKEGKTMDLRVTGCVDMPRVCIDLDHFNFGSVYCGSTATLPFAIHNRSETHVHLTFDLSSLPDFSVYLPNNPDPYKDEETALSSTSSSTGVHEIVIPSGNVAQCSLTFSPKDVAAYDFILPVLVNGHDPLPPPPSHWPPSHTSPQVALGHDLPTHDDTPKRRVMATTLVAPLVVKNSKIQFQTPSNSSKTSSIYNKQVIEVSNMSSDPLTWGISLDNNESSHKRVKDGTFKFSLPSGTVFNPPSSSHSPVSGEVGYLLPNETFKFLASFSPAHHGVYTSSIPLILNGNASQPYRYLELTAEVIPERIVTSPQHIAVQPVPLGITVEAQFSVVMKDFTGSIELGATLPEYLPHGVQMTVHLPNKFDKIEKQVSQVALSCVLTFSSTKPVSITDCVTLTERRTGKTKSIPFSVCADNSLFSFYEFLSENLSSIRFQIDPDTLIPILHLPSQTYVSRNTTPSHSTLSSTSCSIRNLSSVNSSTIVYGELYLKDCKTVLCRYISLFGWPEGLRNVTQPTDLVECVGNEVSTVKQRYAKALSTSRGPLLDLLKHICGRLPPGVVQTPAPCKTRTERVNMHYEELSVVLAFLRSQGALLWIIVPEALMNFKDFCHWRDTNPNTSSFLVSVSQNEFEDVSERTWTHLIAQIIKVLILPKLLSLVPKYLKDIIPSEEEHLSNVYSHYELLLLAWLNHHFEKKGRSMFRSESTSRHISTFDVDLMDCTVLASVLGAYTPYMVDSPLSKMYSEPVTPEQVTHNTLLLIKTVRELGLNYDIQPSDLSAPNPLAHVLFSAHLFYTLPSYTPNTTISMKGILNTQSIQKVNIENQSSKTLEYRTVLLGENSDCFSTDKCITVPPRSSVSLSVVFTVKFLSSCSSVLLLLGKTGRGRQGKALAFSLKGECSCLKPLSVITKLASLYEKISIPVNVTNQFNESAQFSIRIVEGEILQETPKKPKSNKPKNLTTFSSLTQPSVSTSMLKSRSTDSMRLFNTSHCIVTLGPNEKDIVELEYVPLRMYPRQCCVILSNEKLGDMVSLITTSVTLPSPSLPVSKHLLQSTFVDDVSKTLYMKAIVDEEIKEEILIGSRQEAFELAILQAGQWQMSEEEKKRRSLTNTIQYASLQKAMAALKLDTTLKCHWDKMPEGSDLLTFSVMCDSNLFKVPSIISVPAKINGIVNLPIEFSCDTEGHYPCHIVLHSSYDVRVYCVEVMVMDKGRTAELEMHSPALQPLTQKIPIANPTTTDWPLKVDLNGAGFSGPQNLIVKALTTGYYPLTFYPHREGQTEGSLQLINSNDNTEHWFKLKGVGQRPLAQEKVTIHTKAKTRTAHILHVPNTSDHTTVYRVECDLEFISGPPTVTITGGDVTDYPLMIDPLVRGEYTGAVVFVAKTRSGLIRKSSLEHLWYQLSVTVDQAEPIETHCISGHALSEVKHNITISNPFSSPVNLQVSVEGTGLSGSDNLFIESNSQSVYILSYTPLRVGKDRGSILFTGRTDGEITIELELESDNPKPVDLGSATCELGRSAYTTLVLNNPLDNDVLFQYETQDDNFVVVGLKDGQICIPAKTNTEVSVMFKPSQLGLNHFANLIFTSIEFGRQEFLVEGNGLRPSPLTPTIITSSYHHNSTAIISFTNPLSHQATFNVTLKMQRDLFCLFLKQTQNILLGAGVNLDIPVIFAPDSMEMCYAELSVSTNDGSSSDEPIKWLYPTYGQPEQIVKTSTKNPSIILEGKAKERVEKRLNVCLEIISLQSGGSSPSLSEDEADDVKQSLRDKYHYELMCIEDDYESHDLLRESTGLQLIQEQNDSTCGETILSFNLVLLSSKPLKCQAELLVQPVGYGLWRFPVTFIASDPDPDDTIVLHAKYLTKETKTSFRLTSLTNQTVKFSASLTSSSELSVHPITGLLPSIDERGTLFTITYKPQTFNKSCQGRLKIETSSTEWCYEIVGEPAPYTSPSKYSFSRVDHEQSIRPHKNRHKNFLQYNMQQLTQSI